MTQIIANIVAKPTQISTSKERIILGIDPGTVLTGYGIIRVTVNKVEVISYGTLELGKYGEDHPLRLKKIFEKVLHLIDQNNPDELAIEAPFYSKNVQAMLKLGRAQGVAMAAGLYRDIPIFEYAPRKIKQSITGKGNATKEQVLKMLENILEIKIESRFMDASDGLAAAVCHYFQKTDSANTKSYSGWKAFLAENPDRKTKS